MDAERRAFSTSNSFGTPPLHPSIRGFSCCRPRFGFGAAAMTDLLFTPRCWRVAAKVGRVTPDLGALRS